MIDLIDGFVVGHKFIIFYYFIFMFNFILRARDRGQGG